MLSCKIRGEAAELRKKYTFFKSEINGCVSTKLYFFNFCLKI